MLRLPRWRLGIAVGLGLGLVGVLGVGVIAATSLARSGPAVTALQHQGAATARGQSAPRGQAAVGAPSPSTPRSPPVADPSPTTVPAPPYAVAASTIVLTDPTRPTPARGPVPGHEGRTLRTLVRRPLGIAGPLPLIVFAHGFDVVPESYELLLDSWAAAGYLVVAPTFPGSAAGLPGPATESDIPEQARDMSFVISQLLSGVAGPVDPSRIAAIGHSDGGSTVAMLALQPADADPRIRAYVVLAGQIPDGVPGPWDGGPTGGALLAVVGSDDQYGNLPLTTVVYQDARMAKAFVVAAGGNHLDPFLGTTAQANAVRDTITTFLARTLDTAPPADGGLLAATLGPEARPVDGLSLQTSDRT